MRSIAAVLGLVLISLSLAWAEPPKPSSWSGAAGTWTNQVGASLQVPQALKATPDGDVLTVEDDNIYLAFYPAASDQDAEKLVATTVGLIGKQFPGIQLSVPKTSQQPNYDVSLQEAVGHREGVDVNVGVGRLSRNHKALVFFTLVPKQIEDKYGGPLSSLMNSVRFQ